MTEISSTSSSGVNIGATLAILLAALLLPLSFTGGVVTTAAISRDLHGGPLSLAWLTNGFMLTFGSGLLAAGVAADKLRHKHVFITGLALFAVSSLMIALTSSTLTLGIYRALQGIAAALTLAGGPPRWRISTAGQHAHGFSVYWVLYSALAWHSVP